GEEGTGHPVTWVRLESQSEASLSFSLQKKKVETLSPSDCLQQSYGSSIQCTAKTTSRPEGLLGDKDSGGNKTPTDIEPVNPYVADLSGTSVKYHVDQTQSTRLRYQSLTKNKDEPSYESDVDILRAGEEVDKDPQAAAIPHQSSPPQAYKPQSSNALDIEASYTDSSSRSSSAPSRSVTPTLALTHIPTNVEGENEPNTATKDPPSHTEEETNANRQEKPKEPKSLINANIDFLSSSIPQPSITQAQPITIINPEPIIP
nr:hypothetical protein [Tanacetum cinerariifolium]